MTMGTRITRQGSLNVVVKETPAEVAQLAESLVKPGGGGLIGAGTQFEVKDVC